jgi:hypothetical protein
MKSSKAGVEIWDLDGRGIRCALALDGVAVTSAGATNACSARKCWQSRTIAPARI